MRVHTVITGGGTGGHVYPALSIIRYLFRHEAEALGSGRERSEAGPGLLYIGSSRGLERELAPRSGVACLLLPMGAPVSARNLLLLALATLRSFFAMLRYRPRVTFATGGYVSVPASLASWVARVPLVLFLPDVVPGKAVAALVPLARRVAVSTEDALPQLPLSRTVVTGYPVRESFLRASRERGRNRFELPEEATVLCVFGGSQGSRSINQALAACLPELLSACHVLHICGEQRLAEARGAAAGLTPEQAARYKLHPYLHDQDMADALAAADLALCRSGASTIGELPLTSTPAVLVPLPEQKVHQRENARYLAERGAAVIVEDADLSSRLGPVLQSMLSDASTLATMTAACAALARPNAAGDIARLIEETGIGR